MGSSSHLQSHQSSKPHLFDEDGLLSAALNLPLTEHEIQQQPIHVASSPQVVSPSSEDDEGHKLDQDNEVRKKIISFK